MRRGAFLGLCASALGLAGCQVIEPVWQTFTSETGKANDMFLKPFRSTTFMSWNIRAGRGLDGVRDIARAAAVIKDADADFVALQEVDRGTRRANGVDQLAALAEATGLVPSWGKALDHDGGEYGVALLSRVAPQRVRLVPLPRLGKETERRVLLVADFPELRIGVTHLSLDEAERLAAVREIRAYIDPEHPFFLAGDWNDVPAGATVRALRGPFAVLSGFAPTFPANGPARCLDYIAVSRRHRARFETVTHEVLDESVASDHRPVVVRVR